MRPAPSHAQMLTRLAAAGVVCLQVLAVLGLMPALLEAWPGSSRLAYAPTSLGTVGGQEEAQAAGLSKPVSGQGEVAWSVTGELFFRTTSVDTLLAPTAHGPLTVLPVATSASDGVESPRPGTSVAALDPDTGQVRWYRRIAPAVASAQDDDPLSLATDSLPSEAISVSADGEHVALRLDAQPARPSRWDSSVPARWNDDRPRFQAVVVLSTKTGELVRKVETTGENILGQALTDDSLVILTSSTYHPEGGQISAYSLVDSEAPADSWEATGWLAGATADRAILSSMPDRTPCDLDQCLNATVTLNDPTTGAVQNTYDRVTTIHPDGGIERLTDGQEPPPPTPEDEAPWNAAHRELTDLHTGTTIDITGHEVTVAVTPTGRAWLLTTPKTDKQGTTARSWLPIGGTNPDGASTTPSTDPLETITMGRTYENSKHLALIERTTLTMTAGG